MENLNLAPEPLPVHKSFAPKKINGVEVRRLKRQGFSPAAIAQKLDISGTAVYYHLNMKSSKVKISVKSSVKSVADNSGKFTEFEAELFGTIIKLDRIPASIERIGNKIVIK